MNKLVATLCCVVLASSPLALAQDQTTKKKPPVSAKEEADKKKGVQMRMADCSKNAKGKNLQPQTPEFDRYMSGCLKG